MGKGRPPVERFNLCPFFLERFKRFPEFRKAEPLASRVDRADSIAQMEAYLKEHDNARVRRRLSNLKKGVRGVD